MLAQGNHSSPIGPSPKRLEMRLRVAIIGLAAAATATTWLAWRAMAELPNLSPQSPPTSLAEHRAPVPVVVVELRLPPFETAGLGNDEPEEIGVAEDSAAVTAQVLEPPQAPQLAAAAEVASSDVLRQPAAAAGASNSAGVQVALLKQDRLPTTGEPSPLRPSDNEEAIGTSEMGPALAELPVGEGAPASQNEFALDRARQLSPQPDGRALVAEDQPDAVAADLPPEQPDMVEPSTGVPALDRAAASQAETTWAEPELPTTEPRHASGQTAPSPSETAPSAAGATASADAASSGLGQWPPAAGDDHAGRARAAEPRLRLESRVTERTEEAPTAAARPPLPAAEIEALVRRGHDRMTTGDIAAARLFYERAASAGHVNAMRALALTFDRDHLQAMGVIGLPPDEERARYWRGRADEARQAAAR